MIDFIIEAIFTPGPVWVGTAIGILIAIIAWYFLPENIDSVSIGGWAIVVGFVVGLVFTYPYKQSK